MGKWTQLLVKLNWNCLTISQPEPATTIIESWKETLVFNSWIFSSHLDFRANISFFHSPRTHKAILSIKVFQENSCRLLRSKFRRRRQLTSWWDGEKLTGNFNLQWPFIPRKTAKFKTLVLVREPHIMHALLNHWRGKLFRVLRTNI